MLLIIVIRNILIAMNTIVCIEQECNTLGLVDEPGNDNDSEDMSLFSWRT